MAAACHIPKCSKEAVMPWMRVVVQWGGSQPRALSQPTALEALKHIVGSKFKIALLPCEGPNGFYPSLEFEHNGLLGNAVLTAFAIQREISAKYGIPAWVYINERRIEDIVSVLEREVLNAAEKLKRTRSFFGDKRFQEIRLCLNRAVEKAVT